MKNCDMCGSKIESGKCSCGVWMTKEEMAGCPFVESIELFHEMKTFTFTGDAPHLGCAVVFFRGDYNDCEKVEKFIHEMKGRSYYKQ